MEQKRWLVREVDENDRRLERITLTESGRKAYVKLVPMMLKVEGEMIARLGKMNSEALFMGLEALEALYLEPKADSQNKK